MNTESQQNELIPLGPGDLLRDARLKKGISLEQAAQQSRIKLQTLTAIESAETEHIPSIYLKGYVRQYAAFLGVPMSTVESCLQHARGAEPAVQSVFQSAMPRAPDDRWFRATSYLLASAVVIALVWQFTNEAVRLSQGEPLLINPEDSRSAGAVVDSAEISASSSNARPSGQTHLRASIAPVDVPAQRRTEISRSGAEGAWAAIGGQQQDSVSAEVMPAADGLQQFSITTSADSWVEITDGAGRKIEMDLLRAGTERQYNVEPPAQLLLGRASAIVLRRNGQEVDLAPHTRGNVARIVLDRHEAQADVSLSSDMSLSEGIQQASADTTVDAEAEESAASVPDSH